MSTSGWNTDFELLDNDGSSVVLFLTDGRVVVEGELLKGAYWPSWRRASWDGLADA